MPKGRKLFILLICLSVLLMVGFVSQPTAASAWSASIGQMLNEYQANNWVSFSYSVGDIPRFSYFALINQDNGQEYLLDFVPLDFGTALYPASTITMFGTRSFYIGTGVIPGNYKIAIKGFFPNGNVLMSAQILKESNIFKIINQNSVPFVPIKTTPTASNTDRVIVYTPWGGESWNIGSTYLIEWLFNGTKTISKNVNVKLYNGDTGKYIPLYSNISIGQVMYDYFEGGKEKVLGCGNAAWQIPNSVDIPEGSNYYMYVYVLNDDHTTSWTSDRSEKFSIKLPPANITVTSPNNGAEVWQEGANPTVSWQYNGIAGRNIGSTVTVELLENGKTVLKKENVTIGENGQGSTTLTVPYGFGKNYKIKVTSAASTGISSVWDESDNLFTINPATAVINITSPLEGQNFRVRESVDMKWNYLGRPGDTVTAKCIWGIESYLIGMKSITEGTTGFSWTIPDNWAERYDCVIQLSANNSTTGITTIATRKINIKHLNKATFVGNPDPLSDIPSTMETGESYEVSITFRNDGTSTWTTAEGFHLHGIYYSDGSGFSGLNDPLEVAEVHPGEMTTFHFTITAPANPGTLMAGWAMRCNDGSLGEGRNKLITVDQKKEVKITSPASGAIWENDKLQTINYSIEGDTGGFLAELYKGDNPIPVKWLHSESFSYTGRIDSSFNAWLYPWLEGEDFWIKLTSLNDEDVYDVSENITICKPMNVMVVYPNFDGANYEKGTKQWIGYAIQGKTGGVKVDLYKGFSEYVCQLGTAETSSVRTQPANTYWWDVPTWVPDGDDYWIQVTALNDENVYDVTPNFRIRGQEEINITSPNGGKWETGKPLAVNYNITGGYGGYFVTQLWRGGSGGSGSAVLVDEEINTTNYNGGFQVVAFDWNLPVTLPDGEDYWIKVYKLGDPDSYQVSNNFTICTPASVTITSSTQPVYWEKGSVSPKVNYAIAGNTGGVHVELYKGNSPQPVQDLGKYYTNSLASQTLQIDCNFSHSIAEGNDYWLKITSINDPNVYDILDFVIYEPASVILNTNLGGQIWGEGTSKEIYYTITGNTGGVNFYLCNSAGYRKLIGYLPTTSPFPQNLLTQNLKCNLTMPSVYSSGEYWIELTTVKDNNIYDVSDNFTICSPTNITITSPTAGENWEMGSYKDIWYTTTGNTGGVKIELWRGNNVFVRELGSVPSTFWGTVSMPWWWQIPSDLPAGTDYWIKVTSLNDSMYYDVSDNFSISHPPKITLSSPAAGAAWEKGTTQIINYTVSGDTGGEKIELWKGTDLVCELVRYYPMPGDSQSFSRPWFVSTALPEGTDYWIKVVSLKDSLNYDASDCFTICNPQGITIEVPKAGALWAKDTTQDIVWNSSGLLGGEKIDLCRRNYGTDDVVRTLLTLPYDGLAGGGDWCWKVENDLPDGSDYYLRISSIADPNIKGETGNFSIEQPLVTFTAPKDAPTWVENTKQQIQWTYTGYSGTNIKIELLKDGQHYRDITTSTPIGSNGIGTYTWPIPDDIIPPLDQLIQKKDYSYFAWCWQVRITSTTGGPSYDSEKFYMDYPKSDNASIIGYDFPATMTPGQTCEVSVTVKNTGTTTWTGPTIQGQITPGCYFLASPPSFSNAVILNKDETVVPGGTRKFVFNLTAPAQEGPYATSWQMCGPGFFGNTQNIIVKVAANTTANITVTSPVSAQSWQAGTVQTISWSMTGDPQPVKINLVQNGIDVPNTDVYADTRGDGTGECSWYVPDGLNGTYAIRITGAGNSTVSNTSGSFNISPPPASNVISGIGAEAKLINDNAYDRPSDSMIADPIDAASGAHVIELTPLTVQGAQPLTLNLRYNSLMLAEGPLGIGWSHNYETRLQMLPEGSVAVLWSNNRVNTFTYNAGTFSSTDLETKYDSMVKNQDGTYTLTRHDNTVYKFNAAGQLVEQTNGHGLSLVLSYDGSGHLDKVTEPVSGRSLTMHYTAAGLVDSVTDSLNRNVIFNYYADNTLRSIQDPAGQTITYTYYPGGRIEKGLDAQGVQLFYNTYDAKGRVATQDDGRTDNQIASLIYDEASEPGKIITTYHDRNGNTKVLTHNNNYQPVSIKDELGIEIASYEYYPDGTQKSVTDAKDKTTNFTYDTCGNMLTRTDAKGTTTMTYDARNNLTSVTNAVNEKVSYSYNSNNNLIKTVDPLQQATIYDYYTDGANKGLLWKVTKPGQGETLYNYANGQVSTVTDPAGNTATYGYDQAGRLTAITDGAGKTTTMHYDNADNVDWVEDPLGNIIRYAYDNWHNKLVEIDAKGNRTEFTYTANGKLETVRDALQNVTTYKYDGEDRLTEVTDARGKTTTYSYDAKGRLTGITDPLNHKSTIEYDSLDRVVAKYDASGTKILTVTYDDANNTQTLTDALNHEVVNKYDAVDRLTNTTDPMQRNTTLDYDSLGRLTSVIDPMNGQSLQHFDADGNLTALIDPNGCETSFDYDSAGRLRYKSTSLAGNSTTLRPWEGKWGGSVAVDPATTNLIPNTDLVDIHGWNFMDGNNQYGILQPDGFYRVYHNSPTGNANSEILMDKWYAVTAGQTYTESVYLKHDGTLEGLYITFFTGTHHSVPATIEDLGNGIKRAYASYTIEPGETAIRAIDLIPIAGTFTYLDIKNAQLEQKPFPTSYVNGSRAAGKLSYDAIPTGDFTIHAVVKPNIAWDDKTTSNGSSEPYMENLFTWGSPSTNGFLLRTNRSFGTLSLLTFAPTVKTTKYYSFTGKEWVTVDIVITGSTANLYLNGTLVGSAAFTRPNTSILSLYRPGYEGGNFGQFDELFVAPYAASAAEIGKWYNLNTLIEASQSLYHFDEHVYSTLGSTKFTYNNRNLLGQMANGRGQVTSYQYNDDGSLKSFTDPSGIVSYGYDDNGNILTVRDGIGTIIREYDAMNRVKSYTDAQGNVITYDYDDVGNLTSLTYPGGKTVQYSYYDDNRLHTVTDWANRTTTYEYKPNGLLAKILRPNGTALTLSYNAAGQLTKQSDVDSSGNIVSQYDYTYFADGSIETEQGAEAQMIPPAGNISATYTPDNRLATFNGQTVRYDADGNMTLGLLTGSMDDYLYDARNRLTKAGITSYTYDAENNRISVEDGAGLCQYVINPEAVQSQVLIKSGTDGKQTYYVYGLGLIGQEEDGKYLSYHFDNRGSTVVLTDAEGKVTDRVQYGPFGEMVYHDGTTSTPFLYNGRDGVMTDGNGLYYMRARYYNPEVKRFVNQDVVLGNIAEGQSLNRYAYVGNNPASYVDPLGQARDSVSSENSNPLERAKYMLADNSDIFSRNPWLVNNGSDANPPATQAMYIRLDRNGIAWGDYDPNFPPPDSGTTIQIPPSVYSPDSIISYLFGGPVDKIAETLKPVRDLILNRNGKEITNEQKYFENVILNGPKPIEFKGKKNNFIYPQGRR